MKSTKTIPVSYLKNPLHFLSLGFGSGLMPKAPGTFGTLAAIPVYIVLSGLNLELYIVSVIVLSIVGIWLCAYTSEKLGVHDHPGIVIDEFAGYLITMIALPATWLWMLIGFILFRFFDIVKPWPISWLDKHVHGGTGIMLDDILAGLLALGVAHSINYFLF